MKPIQKSKDILSIILYPVVTEKVLNNMEKNNELEFVVRRDANKIEIKKAVEKLLDVKVVKVRTRIDKHGKRAVVKLHPDYSASEAASRLGVI